MNDTLVIVGAGSAGCVLANRLSADGQRRVVLLEAGPDYRPDELPEDLRRGGRNSFVKHDWGYKHRPNPGQWKFPLPRGKVVGGSSAVNTCIALRGQPEDYDEWADRGLDDWSWQQCLPAFRRLETDRDFGSDAPSGGPDKERARWHGNDGPLPIRRHKPQEWTPWQAAFVEGCRELGYEDCPDTNEPGTSGVGPHAMNKTKDGRRISAAEAWLPPEVRGRENLEIRAETRTLRVCFEGDGNRATGVRVRGPDGQLATIDADEVVLCAGAINTPAILMRSGVGPAGELRRLGVEQTVHNPNVGGRLLDHPGVAFFLLPRFGSGTSRKHDLIQTCLRFPSGRTDLPNDLVMQPGAAVPIPRVSLPAVSIMVSVGKPRGQGTLRFPSLDPDESPVVESKLLEHPADLEVACDALERGLEIAQTAPAQKVGRIVWPPVWELRDRDKLEARIKSTCDSGYHPCGTVPMGGPDDPRSACDGRGRVLGCQNLRVADASLMPTIPAANIHLTVLMMAERLAELI